ncbi:MAG: dethiobiotin synthase [Desulfobulbaceae bacterium]|jgi:dethiobiotin synthetase|nr:dethiobiotin synthase [Desulfobulbaceae bacterium]
MSGQIIAVCGVDTDIGKTVATGVMAKALRAAGINAMTQKLIQTGCQGFSEDIARHRQIMGIDLTDDDRGGLTCPYVLGTPCSPPLAARLDGIIVEVSRLRRAARDLAARHQCVLLETAGGLFAPLTEDIFTIDYLNNESYPIFLVTNFRVGSINHSIAALEALHQRRMRLAALVFNHYPAQEAAIVADTKGVLLTYLARKSMDAAVVDLWPLTEYRDEAELQRLGEQLAGI